MQSIGIALGFLKRYVTLSYLKGLRNGSWSKLEVEKTAQFYFIEHTGLHALHDISFFTFAASGSTRVSNEAKFLWEVKF